jgi:hypothetical protein
MFDATRRSATWTIFETSVLSFSFDSSLMWGRFLYKLYFKNPQRQPEIRWWKVRRSGRLLEQFLKRVSYHFLSILLSCEGDFCTNCILKILKGSLSSGDEKSGDLGCYLNNFWNACLIIFFRFFSHVKAIFIQIIF